MPGKKLAKKKVNKKRKTQYIIVREDYGVISEFETKDQMIDYLRTQDSPLYDIRLFKVEEFLVSLSLLEK